MFIHGFAQKGLRESVLPQRVEGFWSKTASFTALLQEVTCQLLNHLSLGAKGPSKGAVKSKIA